MGLKKFMIEQKFRFDLGQSMMVIVNFTLLVITASDNIRKMVPVESTYTLLAILIPCAFLGMWTIGFTLDKWSYYHQMRSQQGKRDPYLTEILEKIRSIEGKLDDSKKV